MGIDRMGAKDIYTIAHMLFNDLHLKAPQLAAAWKLRNPQSLSPRQTQIQA